MLRVRTANSDKVAPPDVRELHPLPGRRGPVTTCSTSHAKSHRGKS